MDLAALRGEGTTWPNDQHRRRTTAPITPKYESKVIVNFTAGECPELTKADCVAETVKRCRMLQNNYSCSGVISSLTKKKFLTVRVKTDTAVREEL